MNQQTKRLLIADDHPEVAEVVAGLLAAEFESAYEVDIATDGSHALALAVARRPVAALLDINMPRLSGIEAATAIRTAFPAEPPLLIACTGSPVDFRCAVESKMFDRVLMKPVDIRDVVSAIERHRAAANGGRYDAK